MKFYTEMHLAHPLDLIADGLELFARRMACDFLFRYFKQIVRRTVQNLAESFHVFVPDRLGLIVHHSVEILVAHPKLMIQPVFCLSLLLQKV